MPDCLFCKIAAGEIPADKVAENDDLLAFRDITPQAPVHVLIIPKKHVPTILDLDDAALFFKLKEMAALVAKQEKVDESGFRLVINCKEDGGQEVPHLHLHLLGKRKLTWPPG